MNEMKPESLKNKLNNSQVRGWLLIIQIVLPFFLYGALQIEQQVIIALTAILFVFSMIFLVWLG